MGRDHAVLTVGEALVDIVVPSDGSSPQEHVGGSPANVALGLAALGHESRLTAYLGQDARGERVVDHLQRYAVQLTPGSTSAPQTSTATARLDGDGVATYDFDLTWRVGEQELDDVTHLHTGSLATVLEPGGSVVVDLMARAHLEGLSVSYDPNCRPGIMGRPEDARQRVEECVGRSDVLKASLEDVEWLYPGAPVEDVVREWGRLGPHLVVVTRGAEGPVVHLPGTGELTTLPARPVDVVDTVGAGDSFMAGLLSGLLEATLLGRDGGLARADLAAVLPALERATACAGWTVQRAGAAAPTRADLPR